MYEMFRLSTEWFPNVRYYLNCGTGWRNESREDCHSIVILGVIDVFTWVKFQQVTRPWNSNIKPDEMTANDIKMGKTPSARYLTSQNATWNVIISVSSNCCIHATRLCNHLKNSILNFVWTVVLKLFYLLKLQSWLEIFESISFLAELKEKEKSLWNFKWKRLFKK